MPPEPVFPDITDRQLQTRAIRGMNDILPGDTGTWQYLESVVRELVQSYGYAEIALFGSAQFLNWRFSYFSASDEAADIFYTSTVSDRVALTLGIEF